MIKLTQKIKTWTENELWDFQVMYEDPDISVEEIANKFGISKENTYLIASKNEISRGKYSDIGYKRCNRCKIVLPVEDFYKNKYKHDGLSCYCKECEKATKGYKSSKRVYTEQEIKYVIAAYKNPTIRLKDMAREINSNENKIKYLINRLRKKGLIQGYRFKRKNIND